MAGYFFDNCFLSPKQLCCAADNEFTNCGWHGDDGSCSNNQCDANTQIQLAESYDGGGGDCGIHLERDRVFCCNPPKGESPFLPVPLDYLFPNPPTDNGADTEFKLSVDDTWGGKGVQGSDSTPNDASFGFFVMTSPDTIQTSLDKRDGSHWELFDCFDSVSEDEQTIRMFCNDQSVDSNCHKISLGHGVPGTIIEMPSGCGPGRYAVAKDMKPSKNQTIPRHVVKRGLVSEPVVYDLTFDYDFRRVPRDLGDTQIRLDYSNQEGYWDGVVDKAGDKRRKRSLDVIFQWK
jgi:chitinase